ncbi:MAG: sugar ABC transporter permease [Spirochaetales bacterium]|nr:sugar ABC transporter permease [Spirochaetales bacterium]
MLKRKRILILLIPALVLYLGLFIFPAIQALWVSLHRWTGFTADMEFVGLANFAELLRDETYWMSLFTTMKIIFLGGGAIFLLAFVFTFFLTSGIRGKKIYRAIIFYPNVVAPIALATFWSFLYNPRFGLVNGLLRLLGLESWVRTWTGPDLVFWAVLVALVWTYVGFYMVILLSGTEKIPPDYYDVARIAGANRVQIFLQVTIPLIWDVLIIAVVLWIIMSIKLFEFLFAFSGGIAAPRPLWTNALYMFMLTFGRRVAIYRIGYGTTVAITMLILVVVFSGIARLAMRREKVEF